MMIEQVVYLNTWDEADRVAGPVVCTIVRQMMDLCGFAPLAHYHGAQLPGDEVAREFCFVEHALNPRASVQVIVKRYRPLDPLPLVEKAVPFVVKREICVDTTHFTLTVKEGAFGLAALPCCLPNDVSCTIGGLTLSLPIDALSHR